MKPESKYRFETFKNGKGFRIFRLKEHVVTVCYLNGGFKIWNTDKYNYVIHQTPINLFCFRNIIKNIASNIVKKVKKDKKPFGWIEVKIGKALAKRISAHLKAIIATLPKDVVEVSRRLFTVNVKNPRPFKLDLNKKQIFQIMKYRAAAYVYNTNWNYLNENWRKSFGKLDKIQTQVLNNLPGNLSINLVCNRLHTTKLQKPTFNRTELLIKLCSYLGEDYKDLILKTTKEEFKKSMKIYNSSLSIRKTKDVINFIKDVSEFKHKCENLLDLVILEKEKNVKNN